MRPRKEVILVAKEDLAPSHLRFVLANGSHYHTTTVHSAQDALDCLVDHQFELMVIFHPFEDSNKLVGTTKAVRSSMPVVAISETVKERDNDLYDAWLYRVPMSDILERIAMMTVRKRGPRRGFQMPPAAAEMFVLSTGKVG